MRHSRHVLGEQDPKEPISWAELRAFTDTRQSRQLLTKRQVLKGNRSVSAADQADPSEEYDKRIVGLTPLQFDAILTLPERNPASKPDRWMPA